MPEIFILYGLLLIIFNKLFAKINIKFYQLLYAFKYNEETIKRNRIIGIMGGIIFIVFGLLIKIFFKE